MLRRHKLESHLLRVAAVGLGFTYTEPVRPGFAVVGHSGVHSHRTTLHLFLLQSESHVGDSGAESWAGVSITGEMSLAKQGSSQE